MATVKLDPAKGVQIPNLTTTERNAISSPETGALIWNTTTSAINQYNGSAWEATDTNTQVAGITSSADATAITINSSENVGIGTTSPLGRLSVLGQGRLVTIGDSGSTNVPEIKATNAAGTGEAFLKISAYEHRIGTNSTQRLTVQNNGHVKINTGNLIIGTSGQGIDFSAASGSAAGSSSAVLDDYEEGTWTPTAAVGSYTGTVYGNYTKVGRAVHLTCSIQGVTDITSATNFDIGGLPFACGSSEAVGSFMTRYINPSSLAETGNVAFLGGTDSFVRMYFIVGTSTYARVQHAHYTSSAVGIRIGITYFTA